MATGSIPKIVAPVVIKIGLSRTVAPWRIACLVANPDMRS